MIFEIHSISLCLSLSLYLCISLSPLIEKWAFEGQPCGSFLQPQVLGRQRSGRYSPTPPQANPLSTNKLVCSTYLSSQLQGRWKWDDCGPGFSRQNQKTLLERKARGRGDAGAA
jgi:hypothetical protein